VWFAGPPHTMQIASVFGDVFRNREQLRHRLERLAQIILVEPGHDHALVRNSPA
jgi:hypothetical protein